MVTDPDRCYRAMSARDARFDGWFVAGVHTTGIYCRPSCPATTPRRANVSFFPTAAAAQGAGFRACKRCRPDASPGSPEWNRRHDVVARAMRLIADGMVDRSGVGGLAAALGYSERHLHRLLLAEVGAGALALARGQRCQTARILIETSDLRFVDVAFAAGFASLRQFNDTIRDVFAATPTDLRRARRNGPAAVAGPGAVPLRLAVRRPFAATPLFAFLARRAVPGVEVADAGGYRRALVLPHGDAVVEVAAPDPDADHLRVVLHLEDLRDLASGVARTRRLLDADADPAAVDHVLGADPALRPAVTTHPGLRAVGAADAHELAVRAVLGQQVSVAAATTAAARLVARAGRPLGVGPTEGSSTAFPTSAFPSVAALAALDPATLPMPRRRAASLVDLAGRLAIGDLRLDVGVDPDAARAALRSVPGIGPWTADYVVMRALGDPDVWLPTDAGVRHGAAIVGIDPGDGTRCAAWRPWRSYVVHHLWAASAGPEHRRRP